MIRSFARFPSSATSSICPSTKSSIAITASTFLSSSQRHRSSVGYDDENVAPVEQEEEEETPAPVVEGTTESFFSRLSSTFSIPTPKTPSQLEQRHILQHQHQQQQKQQIPLHHHRTNKKSNHQERRRDFSRLSEKQLSRELHKHGNYYSPNPTQVRSIVEEVISRSSSSIPSSSSSSSSILLLQQQQQQKQELQRERGLLSLTTTVQTQQQQGSGMMSSSSSSSFLDSKFVKECILAAHRCGLHKEAVDLFLTRSYSATDWEMVALGLPEEVVDSAFFYSSSPSHSSASSSSFSSSSSILSAVEKLLAVTRTTETTLRRAGHVDVVAGLEWSLFRSLWRCFVLLKHVRKEKINQQRRTSASASSSSSSRKPNRHEELEINEAARRIFELVLIVNNHVLVPSSSISTSISTSPSSSSFSSSSSSPSLCIDKKLLLDESTAFKQISRCAHLSVLYSDDSDDGEAKFFQQVLSRGWLQANVSSAPAARYISLIKTCSASQNVLLAQEYFAHFENHFVFKNSNSSSVSLLTSNPVQIELVLRSFWNMLVQNGEYPLVVKSLRKYLSVFSQQQQQNLNSNSSSSVSPSSSTSSSSSSSLSSSASSSAPYRLSPSVIAVAMKAVGETRESHLAAKAMSSLLKSCLLEQQLQRQDRILQFDDGDDQQQAQEQEQRKGGEIEQGANNEDKPEEQQNDDASLAVNSSNLKSTHVSRSRLLASSFEMSTCLLALAKCGHPSFHQALETCLQENLVEASPLRVAELRLQYALNDPVDGPGIVESEISRCKQEGFDVRLDLRCSSLVLQNLLRLDDSSFLKVFREIREEKRKEQESSSSSTSTTSSGKKKGRGINNNNNDDVRVPSAWVDWLVIWSLRRRYELSSQDRTFVLDLVTKEQAPSSRLLAVQVQLLEICSGGPAAGDKDKDEEEERTKRSLEISSCDPTCNWTRKRSAVKELICSSSSSAIPDKNSNMADVNNEEEEFDLEKELSSCSSSSSSSCVSSSFLSMAQFGFTQECSRCPLVTEMSKRIPRRTLLSSSSSSSSAEAAVVDAALALQRLDQEAKMKLKL